MKQNTFYSSLDLRSIEPIDKRMYIDDITTSNLTALFGVDGKYGIRNAVLFNRTSKKYHYFTGTTVPTPNILNPANWAEQVISASGKFVEWANATEYIFGETVYDPATSPNYKFYVCKVVDSTVGEAPYLTSSEWFEVSAGAGVKQTTTFELDLASPVPFAVDVPYVKINLPDLPAFKIFGLTATNEWSDIEPDVVVKASLNKITLTFSGNLPSSGLVDSQDNIKVNIQ